MSLSFDDHLKLFFHVDAGGADHMRDYTPRGFDRDAGPITIDFAVHDVRVATAWALAARVGDTLHIGGPRGSAIIAADFDWYWLAATKPRCRRSAAGWKKPRRAGPALPSRHSGKERIAKCRKAERSGLGYGQSAMAEATMRRCYGMG